MNDVVQQRAASLRRDRVPFVHARVVLAERPTSAKPGDEALVLPDGTLEGFVGGTCAESTVRAQALTLLDSGESLVLRITPEEEAAQPGKITVHNPCLSGGTLELFLEPVVPAPLVVVHGDTPIGRAVGRLTEELGWSVAAADSADLDAAAAVVVASHGRDEEQALRAALRAGVPYVGLVASRKRGEAVLATLDLCASTTSRVRTPAGLDLGARTPQEVALTILAEILASRPRPTGRPLESESAVEQAVDPVCGMTVAAVESSLHLDHEGQRVWFCGTGCLRAFAADPASYS
ncbi:MAG TPA: XdhC family protein [Acidimicrobiales bacterium]|jgi:xanthine dehydrogenase accessory factor|nr:XdhC family protein [Acidimicrobiales bacterium]